MKPESSLSQRVAKGGMWVFILRVVENVLKFLRLVIVARILSPDDFGLFGIALLTMSALETFSQTGFQAALVQKKEDIVPYLDNAWTVSIIRGLFLFCILFFGAPYIALFFNNPKATFIIQVIGFSLLMGGLTNIGIVYLQKELEFDKQFFYRLPATTVDFVVVLVAGLILRNVWALVFGLLAGSLTGVIASYIIHPYRPRIRLDFTRARELFGFGRWVFGSAVLVFLVTQGDDAFVGKFLGATMLGFYQMAYRISNIPATEITHVISQVSFPAYAKIQAEKTRLREAYLRILQVTAFFSCLIGGLILVLAPDFTEIFLGQKWMFMVPVMQVLACAGLVRSIAATTGPLFYAVGMPKVDTRWQFIRLFVMAVLIYPCTAQAGIVGASIAVLVSILISTMGFSYKAMTITGYRLMGFGKIVLPPFINGTIMVVAIFFLKRSIGIQGLLGFFALFIIGVTLYFILAYLFNLRGTEDIRWMVKEGFNLTIGR